MGMYENFLKNLSKLTPEEFLGVCRLLKVKTIDNQDSPKDFSLILNEIIEAFHKESKENQRFLYRVVKKAGGKK